MNTTEATEATKYVMAMFPAWKPTPELLSMMRDTFCVPSLTLDEARAIIQSHVRDQTYGTPSIGAMSKAVRAATNRKLIDAQRHGQADDADTDSHSHRTISDWRRFYASIEGKTEWESLPANVRRGLRWFFRMTTK
jgi:hypothetical protein